MCTERPRFIFFVLAAWAQPSRAIAGLVRYLIAAAVLLSGVARAEVIVWTNSSPNETAFDSLISALDLVNSGQATFSAVTNTVDPDAPFTVEGIYDGLTASYATDRDASFARNTYYSAPQTTLTFFLNTNSATGGSSTGYDITAITAFCGWTGADIFEGQNWTVRAATLSNPNFTDLQSVTYSPPAGSRASMVSITNASSALASGVTAVQFFIQKLSSSGSVFREIDIIGRPTPPSATPPAPTELTAMGSTGLSNALVTLFWEPTPGATGYHIWRSQTNGAGYTVIGSSGGPAYTDMAIPNGKTYHYAVTATNVVGDSAYSAPAAARPTTQASAPLRIMCIGDGNTSGYTDNPYWTIPFEFGYRSGLYLRMTTNGHPVQFVGESPEPWNGTFGLPTNAPSPDLRLLNQDHHRGYAGADTGFVLALLSQWLAADDPDIILMLVGLDDHDLTDSRRNLTNILETIASTRPHAFTIVAQVTPLAYYSQFIVDYNSFVRETLIPAFRAQGKHVSTVDQYANLMNGGEIDPALFSNHLNHPDSVAQDRIAQTWYAGIQAALARPVQVTLSRMSFAGSNVILTGSGGPPNSRFFVLSSADPTLPASAWQTNSPAGMFDVLGNFTYTNSLTPNLPERFFRIKLD